MLVVPVTIPKRKNVCIPDVLNLFFVDRTFIFILQLFSSNLSALNENSSEVVDPFSSFLGGPSLEVESPLSRRNGEAERVEVLRHFVFPHDS